MPKLLQKVDGYWVGAIVAVTLAFLVFAFCMDRDERGRAAKTADWGNPVACSVTNPQPAYARYGTSVREVDIVCPDFMKTILVEREDGLKSTINVWTNARTGKVFIADDYENGGGGSFDREPAIGTPWPFVGLLLSIVMGVLGFAFAWMAFSSWKDWSKAKGQDS